MVLFYTVVAIRWSPIHHTIVMISSSVVPFNLKDVRNAGGLLLHFLLSFQAPLANLRNQHYSMVYWLGFECLIYSSDLLIDVVV